MAGESRRVYGKCPVWLRAVGRAVLVDEVVVGCFGVVVVCVVRVHGQGIVGIGGVDGIGRGRRHGGGDERVTGGWICRPASGKERRTSSRWRAETKTRARARRAASNGVSSLPHATQPSSSASRVRIPACGQPRPHSAYRPPASASVRRAVSADCELFISLSTSTTAFRFASSFSSSATCQLHTGLATNTPAAPTQHVAARNAR